MGKNMRAMDDQEKRKKHCKEYFALTLLNLVELAKNINQLKHEIDELYKNHGAISNHKIFFMHLKMHDIPNLEEKLVIINKNGNGLVDVLNNSAVITDDVTSKIWSFMNDVSNCVTEYWELYLLTLERKSFIEIAIHESHKADFINPLQ